MEIMIYSLYIKRKILGISLDMIIKQEINLSKLGKYREIFIILNLFFFILFYPRKLGKISMSIYFIL